MHDDRPLPAGTRYRVGPGPRSGHTFRLLFVSLQSIVLGPVNVVAMLSTIAFGPWLIVAIAALISWQTYRGVTEDRTGLGRWGCEMSWMTPSYRLIPFRPSRYRLYLYREQGWDNETPTGRPVLFIPGNAGSYQQVRSIASYAARHAPSSLDFYTGE